MKPLSTLVALKLNKSNPLSNDGKGIIARVLDLFDGRTVWRDAGLWLSVLPSVAAGIQALQQVRGSVEDTLKGSLVVDPHIIDIFSTYQIRRGRLKSRQRRQILRSSEKAIRGVWDLLDADGIAATLHEDVDLEDLGTAVLSAWTTEKVAGHPYSILHVDAHGLITEAGNESDFWLSQARPRSFPTTPTDVRFEPRPRDGRQRLPDTRHHGRSYFRWAGG